MLVTADLRRTWAGHTAVEQLCDEVDRLQRITQRADTILGANADRFDDLDAQVVRLERERDEARARNDELLDAARLWRDGKLALMTCGATQTPAYWSAIRQISDGEGAIYRALASATPTREDER